jgi:hypothetical protein
MPPPEFTLREKLREVVVDVVVVDVVRGAFCAMLGALFGRELGAMLGALFGRELGAMLGALFGREDDELYDAPLLRPPLDMLLWPPPELA